MNRDGRDPVEGAEEPREGVDVVADVVDVVVVVVVVVAGPAAAAVVVDTSLTACCVCDCGCAFVCHGEVIEVLVIGIMTWSSSGVTGSASIVSMSIVTVDAVADTLVMASDFAAIAVGVAAAMGNPQRDDGTNSTNNAVAMKKNNGVIAVIGL